MAILAAILLGAGVLRHYWDIYTFKTVRGISFIFVGLDAAGDLFSLCAVGTIPAFVTEAALHPSFDVLGAVIYGTELALWVGILVCGVVFNLWQWLKRPERREEAAEREGIMSPYNAKVRP